MSIRTIFLILFVVCLEIIPVPAAGEPILLGTEPASGETDIPLDQIVTAYFSEKISAPSVTGSGNPFITGEYVGRHDVSVIFIGYTGTPWDTTYYVGCRVRDDFPFAGEQITVTVTDDVTSETGEPLPHGYTWSFRLGATQGSSVFDLSETLPVAPDPLAIISADINNDRILDLVTANRSSDNISILYGNGDGTFEPASHVPVGDEPESVTATDLNRDLHTDLVVANRGSNNLTILINNGNETFTSSTVPTVGIGPSTVISADLNSDGYLDLAVAAYNSSYITIYLNDGTGGFEGSVSYYREHATAVQMLDYDLDYDLDLAIARWSGPPDYSVSWVTLMKNDGEGGFTFDSTYEVGLGAGWIIAANLNEDLYPDLVTIAHYEKGISLLMNNGDGTFVYSLIGDIGTGPYSVRAADCDADGDLDLAVSSFYDDNVTILNNDGNGNFTKLASYPTSPGPIGMAAGDFDGDGDIDLATAGNDQANITVLFNNENTTSISDQEMPLPQGYFLSQNYPNPFNPATAVNFELPRRSNVSIKIFNLLGQQVAELANKEFPAGSHRITWEGLSDEGERVSTGVYFYRMEAEGFVETKKMILQK